MRLEKNEWEKLDDLLYKSTGSGYYDIFEQLHSSLTNILNKIKITEAKKEDTLNKLRKSGSLREALFLIYEYSKRLKGK